MREQTIKSMERRIKTLEREAVRLRKGVVTDTSPLSVDLGDSGVDYANIHTVGELSDGDTVAVLARDNGLLSLGAIRPGPARCHAHRTANLAIGNGTWSNIALTHEVFDTADMHVLGASTIAAPTDGLYYVAGQMTFEGSTAGSYRSARLLFDGATPMAQVSKAPTAIAPRMNLSRVLTMQATETVSMQAWQDSGGNLNVIPDALGPFLQLVRIA